MKTISSLFLIVSCLFTASVFADDIDISKLPPPATKENVTFETDIKPIFSKNSCFKCHGSEKQKGGLRVDSLEAVLKGGKEGVVVVPGKSAESSLVIAVSRLNKKTAMPPKGKPISAEDVALIRAWIDQGAK